jgi:hypothetical protein
MSQEIGRTELQDRTQQLLNGPLKHIRAAALAAALLPLASVAAAPASAQDSCGSSGGVLCGVVFNDTNNNGIRDEDETGIEDVKVSWCQVCDGTDTTTGETDQYGSYYFTEVPFSESTTVAVAIPTGTQASPNVEGNEAFDSDGTPDGKGFSVVEVGPTGIPSDFGFFTPTVQVPPPGTGTPGYWKNHPEAWPLEEIVVGGRTYSKADAIVWLKKVGKDKTTTMFSSLVPAILNVEVGNDSSCVASTIVDAHKWMATYGPVGSNVPASSYAWSVGEPMHSHMDAYNNGLICAPHRN